MASGNKIAIGNNLEEAISKLLSKSAGNIDVTNPDSIEDLVNEIIKANNNLKNSSSNMDWKLFGEDMQTLTSLIEQLERIIKESENNDVTSTNEVINQVENNTIINSNE